MDIARVFGRGDDAATGGHESPHFFGRASGSFRGGGAPVEVRGSPSCGAPVQPD